MEGCVEGGKARPLVMLPGIYIDTHSASSGRRTLVEGLIKGGKWGGGYVNG